MGNIVSFDRLSRLHSLPGEQERSEGTLREGLGLPGDSGDWVQRGKVGEARGNYALLTCCCLRLFIDQLRSPIVLLCQAQV